MRPRYLEIEGLQSFREPQHIDFDRLGETGLFGIFGPTGSGKSTILDAITLALYGNVQRASRGTQGIINTAASSMKVSFTFDLVKANERKTYRVERVYRRKKDSESSIESKVTRLIELGAAGDTVLADKQGEVNDAVIELIGLQFDDFTRSVVLPQNKFQEFLLSQKAEKTKMLERIFYLEEYGRELMDKVNRKLSRLRNKLSGIEGALSVLGDISEDSLKAAETALSVAEKQKKLLDDSLKAAEREYGGAREVWELSVELGEALQKQSDLKSREAEVEALRSRCKRAMAAQSINDRITEIRKTEAELSGTEEELKKLEAVLEQTEKELENSRKELDKASSLRRERIPALVEHRTKLIKALQTKSELAEMEETLQKLRNEYVLLKKKTDQWDESIKVQKTRLEEELKKAAGQKSRLESLKVEAAYRDKVQKGAALEDELESAGELKKQHKARFDQLSGIIGQQEQELKELEKSGEELLAGMKNAAEQYEQHRGMKQWDRNDLLKAETRYYSIKAVTDALKQKHRDAELLESRLSEYCGGMKAAEHKLEELEAEKAEKQRTLEKAKLLLEEKRKEQEKNSAYLLAQSLKDNEPCPVCGSSEHPHPAVHQSGAGEGAGKELIEELKGRVEKLEAELNTLEKSGIKLSEQHNNLRIQKEALEADIRVKRSEQEELLGRLPAEYQELSVTMIEGNLERISGEKQEKLKAVEEWENKLSELERLLKAAEERYNSYQVEFSGKRSQLEANRRHLEELGKAYADAEREYSAKKEAFDNIISPLGITGMKGELQRIQANDRQAESLQRELEGLENSIAGLRKDIEKAEESKVLDVEKLSENMAEGRGFKYRKEEKEKEIKELTGDRDIEAELKKTEEEMALISTGEQKAQENLNAVREGYEKAVKDRRVLEKQRDMLVEKLKDEAGRLDKELKDKGFASAEEVEKAYIPKEELERHELDIKEYEKQSTAIHAHVALVERKLSGRSITEEQWQQTSSRYEKLKLEKEEAIGLYESARNKFETMKSNYEGWLSLGRELQEHSRKKEHLEQFKNLLKGNGFIEYISEERLRYIAKEASETLGTLTRHRYGLELDIENGFVIRDDANGGIRRPVTSLSGGETFLTSLSLALALSSQIQLKGQSPLEFFFLDEGFGTLDSSLLDTVVDALERLSTQKRVIGLISHVPELKSRITRRLVVEAPVVNGAGSRVYVEKA